MLINLNQLPWHQVYNIVDYCIENHIEKQKCFKILDCTPLMGMDGILDIPEKHITWMILRGIL
jgi:hypothetical protein